MLPVETKLHLHLKVAGEQVGFNDVAAWARETAGALGQELIRAALWQMQLRHLESVRSGSSEVTCLRCGVVHTGLGVLRRGTRPRKVRTSSGVVCFQLMQLTCRDCGATWSPYPALLGLQPRARVSEELLRHLFEGVVQLSYAKTARLAAEWLGSSLSARSLHRAVQERACRLEFTEAPGLETIFADGSLVKAGEKKRGEEYCVSFQLQDRVTGPGRASVQKRVIGFGFGRTGWYQAFHNATQPTLVVTDGESGIRQSVAAAYPAARHQLCEWHVPYTVSVLLNRDGGIALERRKQMVAELRGIIGSRDHDRYERFTNRLRRGTHSRAHLEHAKPYIMYEPRSSVRTTSWAERQMRELNRRTDVGVRWSPYGVANMLMLRLATLHNRDDYERIWTSPNPLEWGLVPHP